MAVNECIPYFEPGTRLPASVEAGQSVIGKRFVRVAADIQGGNPNGLSATTEGGNIQIRHATAAGHADGVASHDAAAGDKVTLLRAPMILPVKAGGAIAAGAEVEVGADGKVVTQDAGRPVGRAFADAANDEDCMVAIYPFSPAAV